MFLKKIGFVTIMTTLSLVPSLVKTNVDKSIFHEYDIRGKVGTEFNPEDTYGIAQAIGVYMREQKPGTKKIALGMDGRTHSPAIKDAMTRGLIDSGFDVVFIGTCTTPVMFFTMHTLAVDGGLMITASHNPAEYNGIKICLGKESIFGKALKEIRDLFFKQNIIIASTPGSYSEHDMIEPYIDWLANTFKQLKGMQISAIIDCGNGAGGTVMPKLIQKMQWPNVSLMYAEVDGTFPHHGADPTVEKCMLDLRAALASGDAQLGMGLDGDADRMAAMTKSGKLVTGDRLLSVYARPLLKKYPGSGVVFDVSSSIGLISLIKSWGGKPVMSPTGITHLKKRMKENNAYVAGEISCHFAFSDRNFGFDDGIYAALRLFELLHEENTTLDELLKDFPQTVSSPTYRIPCEHQTRLKVVDAVEKKFSERKDAEMITVDGVRVNFNNGWGIVRLSNTEPLLSIRFEGYTERDLQEIKDEFAAVMSEYIDCSFLK